MNKKELTATYLAMAAFLVCALVLAMPTLSLLQNADAGDVGPGTFPVIILVGIAVLAVLISIKDTLTYKRLRRSAGESARPLSLNLGRTASVMAFLVGFVVLWRFTAFPVAAPVFFIGLSLYLLRALSGQWRRWAMSLCVGAVFSAAVWLIFEWALGVQLH